MSFFVGWGVGEGAGVAGGREKGGGGEKKEGECHNPKTNPCIQYPS